MLADLLPYAVVAIVAVLGFFGYGARQKKKGRDEVVKEIIEADRDRAKRTKERLNEIHSDANPLDRLREQGRLRD